MPSEDDGSGSPLALLVEAIATPIGSMVLVADRVGALHAVDFADCEPRWRTLLQRRLGDREYSLQIGIIQAEPKAALARYFCGDLDAVADITVALVGTLFQKAVWAAVRAIPPGQTVSYGRIARQIGASRDGSARAVGHANAANPFCVVVPCHRLVGASGNLTGYSGGLARKRWLLDHETGSRAWRSAAL